MTFGLKAAAPGGTGAALCVATDRDLASGLRGRRPDTMSEVFRRHARVAATVAYNILRHNGAADDIVQEVFHGLWTRPERYDPDRGTLATFVRVDTRGRSLDLQRSETARRRRQLASFEAPGHSVDPASIVTAGADAAAVTEALKTLRGAEREAIVLAYFAGHSYREVAALLGVPEGTIKSRIRTGLRLLRENLDQIQTDGPAEIGGVAQGWVQREKGSPVEALTGQLD